MAKSSTRGFDAGREHLGYVYAQALVNAAEKSGVTDQVMNELDSLVDDVLEKLPWLRQALTAPKVSAEDKERIVEKSLGSRASRVLVNALKVMARHGRLDLIRDVRNAYRKLYNELRGQVEVHVRVAAPIDGATQERIAQQLRQRLGKEVDLKIHVLPEILGGMIVRVGDMLLDGSVKTRLEQMKQNVLTKTERQLRESLDRFVAV